MEDVITGSTVSDFDAWALPGKFTDTQNCRMIHAVETSQSVALLRALLNDRKTIPAELHLYAAFTSTLLDKRSRYRYSQLLQQRADLLSQAISMVHTSPMALNPIAPDEPWNEASGSRTSSTRASDLASNDSNANEKPATELAIHSGAEYIVGPPGLTLSMFFDSPQKVFGALTGVSTIKLPENDMLRLDTGLEQWRHRLSAPTLDREALASALLTGLIDRLIRALTCKPADTRTTRHLNRFIEERFSELLDMTDMLALDTDEMSLKCASDYHENDRSWRARRLLRQRIQVAPTCAETHALLATILDNGGRDSEAMQAFGRAIELRPDAPELHHVFGLAALRRLAFDQAISSLEQACRLSPQNEIVALDLERAHELHDCMKNGNDERSMPGVDLDQHEIRNGQFHPEKLMVAAELYRRHGTLRLGGAFDPVVIARCRDQFLHDYRQYFSDEKQADALQIGNRRFQVSITLGGAFNDPGFYANPFVLALMHQLLGNRMVIGSTVCATSLPGAKDQHWHKDHRALFTQHQDDTPPDMPPVAITTMIPLVDLDEQIGTTLVRKGSHRQGERESGRMASQVPIVSAGSCFLMDLSLSHMGQGNKTDKVRPIINMVYHQSWFNDNKNFKLQRPLHIPPAEFKKIPKQYRNLVDWAIQPGPKVNK